MSPCPASTDNRQHSPKGWKRTCLLIKLLRNLAAKIDLWFLWNWLKLNHPLKGDSILSRTLHDHLALSWPILHGTWSTCFVLGSRRVHEEAKDDCSKSTILCFVWNGTDPSLWMHKSQIHSPMACVVIANTSESSGLHTRVHIRFLEANVGQHNKREPWDKGCFSLVALSERPVKSYCPWCFWVDLWECPLG